MAKIQPAATTTQTVASKPTEDKLNLANDLDTPEKVKARVKELQAMKTRTPEQEAELNNLSKGSFPR